MPKTNAFLRFLNLARAVRELPGLAKMDPTEERLLQDLGEFWYRGEQVPVLKALEIASDGSPSTTHRRLKALRKKGLIDLQVDERDARIKYVVPTAPCLEYFQRMSRLMDQAVCKNRT